MKEPEVRAVTSGGVCCVCSEPASKVYLWKNPTYWHFYCDKHDTIDYDKMVKEAVKDLDRQMWFGPHCSDVDEVVPEKHINVLDYVIMQNRQ